MRKKLIVFVIAIWLTLSFVRVVNNYIELIRNDSEYFSMNLQEKRNRLFPCYPLVEYFKSQGARNILYVGSDGFCYFALRYFLYPSKIVIVSEANVKYSGFDHILSDTLISNEKKLINKILIAGKYKFIYK